MKKTLLATSAIVALSGAAFADGHAASITLSGSAQGGITNGQNGGDSGTDDNTSTATPTGASRR